MSNNQFLQHLLDRGWDQSLNTYVDWDNEIVTFPLYTRIGVLIGKQEYRWREEKANGGKGLRYMTVVSPEYKGIAAYGWNNQNWRGPIYLTEGIFSALRVRQANRNALALLTCTPTPQMCQLLKMQPQEVVALVEPGCGHKMRHAAHRHIEIPHPHEGVDDMSAVEVNSWLGT